MTEEKPLFVTAAEQIIKLAEFDGRPFVHLREGSKLLQYREGVYEEIRSVDVDHFTENQEPDAKASFRYEVLEKIKVRSVLKGTEDFDSDPMMLNLQNGIIDVTSPKHALVEHDAEFYSMSKLPIEYAEGVRPVGFLKFIAEILPDVDDRYTVLEELATCLLRRQQWQRFYVWIGKGANGKGTLIRVAKALLGPANVEALSLQAFQNRFNSSNLVGKLANFGADIGEAEIKDTSLLKTVTGADSVNVERKHVQSWTTKGEIYIKCFFSANTLPLVKDSTDAWDRRAIVTEFPVNFEEEAQDMKLTAKLTTPEELTGILNVLLRTLAIMERRGRFAHAPSIAESRALWAMHADPVQAFINDCVTFRRDASMAKEATYEAYIEYAKKRGFKLKTRRGFSMALADKFAVLGAHVQSEHKEHGDIWVGAGLKGKEEPRLG